MNAPEILKTAIDTIDQRGADRDEGSERSMLKAVTAFNALTEKSLTETEGWEFMICLKLARANGGNFRLDDWIDGGGYMALAGECESKCRK